jgi:hypothetical protein
MLRYVTDLVTFQPGTQDAARVGMIVHFRGLFLVFLFSRNGSANSLCHFLGLRQVKVNFLFSMRNFRKGTFFPVARDVENRAQLFEPKCVYGHFATGLLVMNPV